MRPSALPAWLVLAVTGFVAGCGGTATPPDPGSQNTGTKKTPALEVLGTWDDDFGDVFVVTPTKWGSDKLVSFDDATRSAITQAPADDPYTPNQFSKLVWTKPDATGFWMCTVTYGEKTADDAKHTSKTADATHPDQGGCGNFPWSRMHPHFELDGVWDDNYGETTTISATMWGTSKVVSHDDQHNVAVVQSPADDPYTPNQFSKYVWTQPDDSGWWFCIVDYGKASAAEAMNDPATADATHPDQGGCGDFPWTHMVKSVPKIELVGSWVDDAGNAVEISPSMWGSRTIVSFDNDANSAVLQNGADDPQGANLFSKVVWTQPDDTGFYACVVESGLATAADASASTKTADDSDPSTGGCDGAPWTHLAPAQ